MFKSCSSCNELKSFTEFNKDAAHATGHKAKCKVCTSLHYQKNKRAILARNKKYVQRTQYAKNRRKIDPCFRIAQNLRVRLYRFIKSHGSNISAIRELGCTLENLKFHLESMFQSGMTWENYGKWEIDHIIPLSSAKTKEDLVALCYYANLQPLWKEQNRIKFNKVA